MQYHTFKFSLLSVVYYLLDTGAGWTGKRNPGISGISSANVIATHQCCYFSIKDTSGNRVQEDIADIIFGKVTGDRRIPRKGGEA